MSQRGLLTQLTSLTMLALVLRALLYKRRN